MLAKLGQKTFGMYGNTPNILNGNTPNKHRIYIYVHIRIQAYMCGIYDYFWRISASLTTEHKFELENMDTYPDVDLHYTNDHRLRIRKDGYLPMLMYLKSNKIVFGYFYP